MGKKLLLLSLVTFLLIPSIFWGQACPTSVSISSDQGNTICENTSVTFTANTSGGSNLHYQWQIDGGNVGTDSNQYTTSSLANGNKVKVIVTSTDDAGCSIPSNPYTMTVNTSRTPTVSISSSPGTKCVDQNITFTASNTNGGTNPSYAWYVNSNSSPAQSSSSNTFSLSTLPAGTNTVKVVLTSSLTCVTSTTAEKTVTITVNDNASITPTGNQDKDVCINTALDPIIYAIGGSGTGATVTGLPSGVSGNYNSGNFTISGTPSQTGVFNYSVTTTGPCGQNSESGTITVNKNATISLSSGNNTQEVCQDESIEDIIYNIGETGNNATVTGLPSGISGSFSGGLFTISGSSSQTGTHNFTIYATGTCGDSSSLNGTITINQNLTPSVSISSSETDNEICDGTSVTFTATPTNGGATPSYQWKIDGNNAGSNSSSFTTNSLTNGQSVTVEMTSSETCVTQATVTSNSISTIVNDNLTPAVSIEASDSDICEGNSVTFTATPTNGGTSPSYQWKVDGNNVGSNNNTYTTSNLTNGQSVSVVMTSNETCVTTTTATSNEVAVTVRPPAPGVPGSISGATEVCSTAQGLEYSITAVENATSYTWTLPSGWSITSGNNTNSIKVNASNTSGNISVIAENSCGESSSSSILSITSVNGVPATPGTIYSDLDGTNKTICPPTTVNFNVNGNGTFKWTLPSDWEIVSGAGTNTIQVKITDGSASGTKQVSVVSTNICGESNSSVYSGIVINDHIVADFGEDKTICKSQSSIQLSGNRSFGSANLDVNFTTSGSGTFSNGPGGSNKNGPFTVIYTPSTADKNAGQVTLTMTVPEPKGNSNNGNKCGVSSDSMILYFTPDATISNPANKSQTVCINTSLNAISFNIGGGATGATINNLPSGLSGSYNSGIFKISGTPTQTGTFNYTVNTTGSCTSQQTSQTGTITVSPNQTISNPANKNQDLCINNAISEISFTTNTSVTSASVTGLPAGLNGNYSSGIFKINGTPTEAGTFNYTVTTSGNCANTTQTGKITVSPNPTISAPSNKDQEICINTSLEAIEFTITSPGTGATTTGLPAGISGSFNNGKFTLSGKPTAAGTFDYTVTTTGSCVQASQNGQLIIKPDPTASISYSDEFCTSQSGSFSVALTGTGEYEGGTFYSTPSGLTLDANSGEITPGSSTPGTYTVNYDTPAGCKTATATTTVLINAAPSVEISYGSPFCTSDNSLKAVTFTNGVGNYEGGTFSSTPGGLDIDTDSGEINPANSSPGTYTITYKIPAAGGCEEVLVTTTVEIKQLPQVDISYSSTTFCNSDSNDYSVTYSGTAGAYENGTFSGTDGLDIAPDGNINPANSSVGHHTITYTVDPANGCSEVVATTEIDIYQQVQITTQPVNYGICSSEPADFEVIASGDNLKYQWFKNDGTGNFVQINGETSPKLHFNNATSADAGEYHVVVSSSNGVCDAVTSDAVTLNVDENIVITKPVEDKTICEEDYDTLSFEYEAHANGAPLTFTWIKDGSPISQTAGKYTMTETGPTGTDGVYSGTLTIENITTDDSGLYAVAIDGPDYFTCPEATSKTFTFRVNARPPAPGTTDLEYCLNSSADALTANAEDGNSLLWYSKDTDGNLVYLGTDITPETDEPGTTSYWVTQKNPNSCESDPSELKVTVLDKPDPVASETIVFDYCHNEEVTEALAVTPAEGATLNWYDAATGGNSISTPVPPTNQVKVLSYWVSQTFENGCESDRTKVEVNINQLPNIQISIATGSDSEICFGSSTTLQATGATSYSWSLNGTEIGTDAEITVTPASSGDIIYKVTGLSDKGCTNTSEITIKVDPTPEGGTLAGPASVCENNTSGVITLSGQVGTIDRWEYMDSSTSDWTALANTAGKTTYDFTSLKLSKSTKFRAVITSGVCDEAYSSEHTVNVDPLPKGGILLFADNDDRIFTICEDSASGYASDLSLSGEVGQVVSWQYRNDTSGWTTISGETGTVLTASKIESLINNKSTAFRVEISSGACSPNKFSETAIISVIPTDIEPTPVQVTPRVVCKGEEVTLSSSTGYGEQFGKFEGGAFDNSSIVNKGWRITDDKGKSGYNFSSDADNIRPEKWLRTTPHDYITANLSSPYTVSLKRFASKEDPDGNKGFAIVSGHHPSTLETPVFSLSGLDEAVLTFDQAYNLVNGASIEVQISENGGSSYTTLYTVTAKNSPEPGETSGNYDHFGNGTPGVNQMEIDLGDYLFQTNLRIRFKFNGMNDGDIWTLDNIKVPEGPRDISLEWRDYSDPATYPNGEYIGDSYSEQWEPKLIGWNKFEVKTKIILDSNGNSCTSIENAKTIRVFVFDQYETDVTAESGSCGSFKATLSASANGDFGGAVNAYPTADGYIGKWYIEINGSEADPATYTLSNADSASTLAPVNNPNAIFEAENPGDFTFTWQLVTTEKYPDDYFDETLQGQIVENTGCPPNYIPQTVTLTDCTTLDFDGVDDYITIQDSFAEAKTIEMWVYPEASTGVIFSGPGIELKMSDISSFISPNTRWYHIALFGKRVYIDGIDTGKDISGTGVSGQTLIGGRWDASAGTATNLFSGWIEEVRIWKAPLTLKQLHFMMNQRLDLNSKASGQYVQGEVVPNLTVAGSYYTSNGLNLDKDGTPFYNLKWDDLISYYRLISAVPDPVLNLIPTTYKPVNGYSPNLALSGKDARLHNMETDQQNTSPTPYFSGSDGTWASANTWARPSVWDYPNSTFNGTAIDWNIARTGNNITSDGKNIIMLGLLSDSGLLTITADHPIQITHYLLLDGNMDLVGESQLLQDQGSILAESSGGWLQRDQQGRKSSFNYNYWSSPVSKQGDSNNANYALKDILLDGTDPNNPKPITFKDGYYAADGSATSPVTLSNYWVWNFIGGKADTYADWTYMGSTDYTYTGSGYSMKGTDGTASLNATQNYVFQGKPHNGDITLSIGAGQNYLIGNPYPSAIDANEFIRDNLSSDIQGGKNNKNTFNGVVYYWDHFANQTHILAEYIGGYATYTLAGGVEAISVDERIDATNQKGSKKPLQYIPVGQGFFINSTQDDAMTDAGVTIAGGDFVFKNSQRIYKTDNDKTSSIFLSSTKKTNSKTINDKDVRPKIRLKYNSPSGYHRQILVTQDSNTSNNFDLGYDAPLIEDNVEDMYWLINNYPYVIQAVGNFDEDQVLPLAIKVREKGEFSIQIDSTENWQAGKEIYLKDNLLDSIADIKKQSYVASSEAGEIKDRFELVFFKPTPDIENPEELPVIDDIGISYSTFTKQVKISNQELRDVSKVMIFDMGGKLIQEFDDVPTEREILLTMRPVRSAVYIVKVFSGNGVSNQKIIVKN